MRKTYIWPLLAFALIASTTLSAFSNFDQPVNFSGTWLLNTASSEMGQAPIAKGKSSIKILQQQPSLIMEKSLVDSLGNVHSGMDTLVFGKTVTLDAGNGQQIQRTISQDWSADKQVMKLSSKFSTQADDETIEFSGTESWSLSADGKVLTIVNETVLPDRTEVVKLVYNRK